MARIISALWSPSIITQFVSIGVVGAVAETIIVAVATTGFGISSLAAKAVGAEVSIVIMFLLNDRITFSSEGSAGLGHLIRRWGRSHVVRIGGLAVAFATLWLLTAKTNVRLSVAGADLWPTVANGIGIGVGMVINYIGECLFTWELVDSGQPHNIND